MSLATAAMLVLIVASLLLAVDLTMTFSGHDGQATRALGVIASVFVLAGILLRAKSRRSVS